MKIIFNINYRTNWGESVYITGNHSGLGDGDYAKALKMTLDGNEHWSAELIVEDTPADLDYRYIVIDDNGSVKEEWGHGNHFSTADNGGVFRIFDRWQDQPFDKPFYSSAFTECIFRHKAPGEHVKPIDGFTTLCVAAPMVGQGRVMAVCGQGDTLGNWDPKMALKMSDADFPVWKVNVPSKGLLADTEYKFLILNSATGEVIAWEGGQNRYIGVTPTFDEATVLSGMRFINSLTPWRGAGTAIPVFALRTEEDFGVGDFYDIINMVDWAASTGQTFLQLLPVNDTTMTHTWTDSYPYNANSTFALHPMYLRAEELGVLKNEARRKYYAGIRAELNALPQIDYERANNIKNEYYREIFAQEGSKTLKSAAYKDFVRRNAHWLHPYAAFCTLRDSFGTPDFSKWGEYAVYSPTVLKRIMAEHPAEIDFVCYLQFHLDKQMRHVHDYANAHGIALKGDIPIGISRTSADAWQAPRLFNLDCQAGAPPDDFSVLGQNWGFPTYNWEEMNRDGFAWWKARFSKMAEFFDAYRIDHVLGFFRIWQIPMDAIHGLLGYFSPALPYSVDELRYSYDFWINPELQTKPYIMDYFLGRKLGLH